MSKISNTQKLTSVIAMLVAMSVAVTSKAFAISIMWGWFITHEYGVNSPSIPVIIGFIFLFGIATYKHKRDRKPDVSPETFFIALSVPWLAVGMSWVATLFI